MRVRSYALVTAGYWAFTVTDGALRMLVLLHFHELGYSAVQIAVLFVLYESMGILTNLLGGWVGSAHGLNRTLIGGLSLQVASLILLSFHSPTWPEGSSVAFVMGVQALSGIAKDLTKMSSKSAVKVAAQADAAGDNEGRLFRWVAILTGSKNALKGVGFFVGAALLTNVGFERALQCMAAVVALALICVAVFLDEEIGKAKKKPPLRSLLSKSPQINRLSAARFFLFGARDLWFVVALPVFLADDLGWAFESVGAFLAVWVIGYGIVQTLTPTLLRVRPARNEIAATNRWALLLCLMTAILTVAASAESANGVFVVLGLLVFGVIFAVNSSLHSYLILNYSNEDTVAMDVGFYYSANAAGRLAGTVGSGVFFLAGGLDLALGASTLALGAAWLIVRNLSPTVPDGGPPLPE